MKSYGCAKGSVTLTYYYGEGHEKKITHDGHEYCSDGRKQCFMALPDQAACDCECHPPYWGEECPHADCSGYCASERRGHEQPGLW